jgi:hypothetical protein
MTIDINTLYHLSVTVSVLLGLLLLYGWWSNWTVRALAWWGAGMMLIGVGLGLLAARGNIHPVLSIVVANAAILFGAGSIWTGTRVFDNRKIFWPALIAGPTVWVIVCLVPAFYGSINARAICAFTILGIYTTTGAFELWKGRGLPLLTRWPAIVLLAFHGGLFFVRIALVVISPLQEGLPGRTSLWFVVLLYEVILYEIALSFSFFAMAKERTGQRLVVAQKAKSASAHSLR